MKITLDLPVQLVRQVKQRVLQEGRTLREPVADSIRLGLLGANSGSAPTPNCGVKLDPAGLPVFRAEPAAKQPRIDLATALPLEHACLAQEERRHEGPCA
jgi:hypothetical protein